MKTAAIQDDPGSLAILSVGIAALLGTIVLGVLGGPVAHLAADPRFASVVRTGLCLVVPIALVRLAGTGLETPRQVMMLGLVTAALALPLPGIAVILCAVLAVFGLKQHLLQDQVEGDHASLWLPFLGFVLLGGVIRLFTFAEPFERDLMVYATVAQSWLDGARLYADVWDHKPPALYVTFGTALALFGQSPTAIYALGLSAFAVTLLGVCLAARRLAGDRAALLAGLIWAILGSDPLLQANQPNVEVFMNACLVWALYFLLAPAGVLPTWRAILVAAILFFVGSAFKQVMVFPAAFAGLALCVQGWRLGELWGGISRALLLGAVGIIGWAAIAATFYLRGTFDDFLYGAFGYNQSYSGSLSANVLALFTEPHPVYYFALFAGILAAHAVRSSEHRHALIFAMGLGTILMVAAPGQYFPHYYQLLLPFIALGGGWIGTCFLPVRHGMPIVMVALMPIWVAFGYMTDPERVAFVKYGEHAHGGEAADSKSLGRWLTLNGYDMDTVLHVGAEPGIYFWSGQSTPYKYPFHYPLFNGSRQDAMAAEFIREASCREPALVIVGSRPWKAGAEELYDFLDRYYVATDAPVEAGGFQFLVPGSDVPPCN